MMGEGIGYKRDFEFGVYMWMREGTRIFGNLLSLKKSRQGRACTISEQSEIATLKTKSNPDRSQGLSGFAYLFSELNKYISISICVLVA